MTAASQMEIHMCQRTVGHLNRPMLLVQMRESTVTAGTSQCRRVHTMSQRMAESVSQQDIYGDQGMHYMALQATTSETNEDLFHDSHLQLRRG